MKPLSLLSLYAITPDVTTLSIAPTCLSAAEMLYLSIEIPLHKNIHTLDFSNGTHNNLSNIIDSIIKCPNIINLLLPHLRFHDTNESINALTSICSLLRNPLCNLKYLDLST